MLKNNELLTLKTEILAYLVTIDEIAYYQQVQDKMLANEKIMNMIAEKKDLQKQLVNVRPTNKINQIALVEAKIDAIEQALMGTPLYQQYLYAMEDAQTVLDEISAYFQEQLSIEGNEDKGVF